MSLAPRGVAVPPFYAGEVGRRAFGLARAGRRIIPMHFGQPTAGAPPSALAAATEALARGTSGYWESQALRERIAQHYLDTHRIVVDSRRILLTNGASAGLVALFTALFSPGDRVGVTRPGYPAYRNALTALSRVPIDLACAREHGYRLTIDTLERTDDLQGLIVASPGNPTGAVYGGDDLAAIAEHARARDIRLVSDEIYHGIAFDRETPSMLKFEPDALVVNSFSKYFRMPGWRLGWIVAPDDCVGPLSRHLDNFFLTPSTIAQHAALAAFDDDALLRESVAAYRANRDRLVGALRSLGIESFSVPDGAFYLYVDLSSWTTDSLGFCLSLLEATGLSIAPGIDFDPVAGRSYVRFSFAILSEELEVAIALLTEWLAASERVKPAASSR